jgi:hypothetical protein
MLVVSGLLLGLLLEATPIAAQSSFEVIRLASSSPVATDGKYVYGVADDLETVLRRPLSGVVWEVLLDERTVTRSGGSETGLFHPSFSGIAGMAYGNGRLFIGDRTGVWSFDLRNQELSLLPIDVEPGELAWAGQLFVAARTETAVLRWEEEAGTGQALDVETLGGGPFLLAASADELLIVSTRSGRIAQLAGLQPHPRLLEQQTRSPLSGLPPWARGNSGDSDPKTAPGPIGIIARYDFPPIESPIAVAIYGGDVYAIAGPDRRLQVAYRNRERFAPLASPDAVLAPTRVLATAEDLFVLDGEGGVLKRWPRYVPTELDLGSIDPEAALEALYLVLLEAEVLPTRTLRWRGSLEATLEGTGVTIGPPGRDLRDLSCWLNGEACADGALRLEHGAPFVAPDLPSNRVLSLETRTAGQLESGLTLGDEVDRRVMSAEFESYTDEEKLVELNRPTFEKLEASGAVDLRGLRVDHIPSDWLITLPVERARYVVPLPLWMLRDSKGPLVRLRERFAGFNWVPLEDQQASAYAAFLQPPDAPADLALVEQRFEEMLATIHYKLPASVAMTRLTQVGVAEQVIDTGHPDFTDPAQAFIALPGFTAATPASTSVDPDVPRLKEALEPGDHGTAVAWLIGSRADDKAGLAPSAFMVPMPRDDPAVGDAVRVAYLNGVRIFNLSLHFGNGNPVRLRESVNSFPLALFVVAAGNDPTAGTAICDSLRPYPAYPVCEGYRHNVLVVAATNIEGNALLAETDQGEPGSNWNRSLVHVAAPGEGFYAAGMGFSYALVRGTSFATPLVTATAALLYAQGLQEPWLIKQRIIATADAKHNLRGKVFGEGLLNVERAVTLPTKAALVDNAGNARYADLLPGTRIEIEWTRGRRVLPLEQVRRLSRMVDGRYRIVYLDDVTDTLVIQEGIEPGSWPFSYREVNEQGVPMGAPRQGAIETLRDYVGPVQ